MPCRNDGAEEWDREQQVKELHKVTRILCEVMGKLPNGFDISSDASDWWSKHQEADRLREEKDKAAKFIEKERLYREKENIEARIKALSK